MARLSILRAAIVMAGICLVGCYTDSINEKPTVSITPPTETIVRGAPATFTAIGMDANDGPAKLGYDWGFIDAPCPPDGSIPTGAPLLRGAQPAFAVTPSKSGDYCVWVTVSDPSGATSFETRGFQVTDSAPLAVITAVPAGALLSAVPLYSKLRFSSAGSHDLDSNDEVTVDKWELARPAAAGGVAGVAAADVPGCAGSPGDVCFDADLDGGYVLKLTVKDREGQRGTATHAFTVLPDAPPCIAVTAPMDLQLQWALHDPQPLRVASVLDDGDPFPSATDASKPSFLWKLRVGSRGPFQTAQGVTGPEYPPPPLENELEIGDTFQVRVEAQDRVLGRTDTSACDPEQPICVIDTCRRWVTWTVLVH